MEGRIATVLLLTGALVVPAESASAQSYFVPCWLPGGIDVSIEFKPRSCVMGGRHGYKQANIRKISWRSWGGRTTYGRGTLRANMGFRAPVRFRLYRPQRFNSLDGPFWVYRWVRGTTLGQTPARWKLKLAVQGR
jgi:hypothetical protein